MKRWSRSWVTAVATENPVRGFQIPQPRAFENRSVDRLARPETARMVPGCRISLYSCPTGYRFAGGMITEPVDGMRRPASDAGYHEVPKSSTGSKP